MKNLAEITNAGLLFTNSKNEECPITKCEVLSNGCSSPNLLKYISVENNFSIKAEQNVKDGYSEKVCFKCSGGVGDNKYSV